MSEANKEEIEKCKQIAQAALAGGDAEKASRFLQKAKRMCPTDTSIDELLAKVPEASASPPHTRSAPEMGSEGPRQRSTAGSASASNVRTTKESWLRSPCLKNIR